LQVTASVADEADEDKEHGDECNGGSGLGEDPRGGVRFQKQFRGCVEAF